MSCLWQSYKIPGFCYKKDIMMGLRSGYLQTKIRYGCSSPFVCSNDLRVLVCFNLICLRHI